MVFVPRWLPWVQKNEAISLPRGYQLPEGPVFPVVQASPSDFHRPYSQLCDRRCSSSPHLPLGACSFLTVGTKCSHKPLARGASYTGVRQKPSNNAFPTLHSRLGHSRLQQANTWVAWEHGGPFRSLTARAYGTTHRLPRLLQGS